MIPVVGCVGSCGASTLTLALAIAAGTRARVVECSPPDSSGLAAASTAELGVDACSSWTRGRRGEVLIERVSDQVTVPADIPVPSEVQAPVTLTFLDVGWDLGQMLASPSWLADQLDRPRPVVLVTCATVPGLRRLETALNRLGRTSVVTAATGRPRSRWPKIVRRSLGQLTRELDAAGRLVAVPRDHRLQVAGLDSTPLPSSLLVAAAQVLRLLEVQTRRKGRTP